MSMKADIRDTPDYKKFKKIVMQVHQRLNIEKDRDEAVALHAGRTSRKLFGEKRYSPKAMIDASMNDLGARSRLVEIRVRCSYQVDTLNDASKAIRNSIMTAFAEDMKAKFKTVGERTAFIDTVIAGALEIERDGKAFIKMLDDLVLDIDKASYHLRAVLDSLQLLESSKGGKVI